MSLPSGGGGIRGISEDIRINAARGTSSLTIGVPIAATHRLTPDLALSYDSGTGKGVFGLGWHLSVPMVSRRTEKELPRYLDGEESDVFVLSGSDDLVPLLGDDGAPRIETREEDGLAYEIRRYRPRIEAGFQRIERWTQAGKQTFHWRVIDRNNTLTIYGQTDAARVSDPNNARRIFKWYVEKILDDKGGCVFFEYKKEDAENIDSATTFENHRSDHAFSNLYLKRVLYGNAVPYWSRPLGRHDFLFQTVLDYGDHDPTSPTSAEQRPWPVRDDPFSSYRSGFEIRTYRQCQRILLFHDFSELGADPTLVRALAFKYERSDPGFSLLTEVSQSAYVRKQDGSYEPPQTMPPASFDYEKHRWDTEVQNAGFDEADLMPGGVDQQRNSWVALHGDGLSGILSQFRGGLYYRENAGDGSFAAPVRVADHPSSVTQGAAALRLVDLEGDGQLRALYDRMDVRGFQRLSPQGDWSAFQAFGDFPNIDLDDPGVRLIDLDGDGRPDILITEDTAVRWYRSEGEKGYRAAETAPAPDGEDGPRILFGSREESIFLADMSGDGLQDIVSVRNGEIVYWPNLGYGAFGRRVVMADAPHFDHPDAFNPAYLRLADLDGTGLTDVIYLGRDAFRFWMNQSGNRWSEPHRQINPFPEIAAASSLSVIDLLGSGTACVVWSSSHPRHAGAPMRYVDLMAGRKPFLMTGYRNGMGKEITLEYTPSTRFYLEDKRSGRHWISKLHFPVQCLSKVVTTDHVTKTRFSRSYTYHHGYYDRAEKEFRGFGRVDRIDTEEFSVLTDSGASNASEAAFHQPPVLVKSWFHTGAHLGLEDVHTRYRSEIYRQAGLEDVELPDQTVPDGLAPSEWREAIRACKGKLLRTETYALDGTDKEAHPYSVVQNTHAVSLVQAKGGNRHAAFMVLADQSLTWQLDRNPDDPRVSHSVTLERDELGNPLASIAIGYPRRTTDPSLPAEIRAEQQKLTAVLTQNRYTGDIDIADHSADHRDDPHAVYRLRQVFESIHAEVTGIEPDADLFSRDELLQKLETPGSTRRVLKRSRTYYLNDRLDGPLALGVLAASGLSHHGEQLAFTTERLAKVYGDRVSDGLLSEAGYVHSLDETGVADTDWWTPSGSAVYGADAAERFFMPAGMRDPFGNQTVISYDAYSLLPETVTNALGRQTIAINDYRTLSPVMVRDENENWSAVETDAFGLVVKSASMGKLRLAAGETPSPRSPAEADNLDNPSAALAYDVWNWQRNGRPNYVHTTTWEEHHQARPDRTKTQQAFAYSDGSGTVVMTKMQTSPGTAKERLADGRVIERDTGSDLRWIGTGRTIINNKGQPVRQYEPYFSVTADYEDDAQLVEIGQSSTLFYDPAGRQVGALHPNRTFEKTVASPWRAETWDRGDTVLTADPAEDADVGAYFSRLPRDDYWPSWHQSRTTGSPAPDVRDAAQKSEAYAATPAVAHVDALGRVIYTMRDNGPAGHYTTRSILDVEGNTLAVIDERQNQIVSYRYDLLPPPDSEGPKPTIYQNSADGGERWILFDVMGNEVRAWDSLGRVFRSDYDVLRRLEKRWLQQGTAAHLTEVTLYGEAATDAAARNLNGRAWKTYDQSGLTETIAVDFKGNLTKTRKVPASDYQSVIDWDVDDREQHLGSEQFTAETEYDALSRVVLARSPSNDAIVTSEMRPLYDESGGLAEMQVRTAGGTFSAYVTAIDYDAKGQRQRIAYGNGVTTDYAYDEETYELTRLRTTRSGSDVLQDLTYTYDAVGNVTSIRDEAQQTHFFKNAVVEPHAAFTYDPLYRLIKAQGREHRGQASADFQSGWAPELHPNDGAAMRSYSQEYSYDGAGNVQRLNHIADGGNWTRRYEYASDSNRLLATTLGSDPALPFDQTYDHDTHGSMTRMPHLAALVWDHDAQLREVDLGGGGRAYYVYGADGQRARKVHRHAGAITEDRLYIGDWELYRKKTGGTVSLARETLHIMDDQRRIALIETQTVEDGAAAVKEPLVRYQLGNHLGSTSLEVNAAGQVISYEEYHPYGTTAYYAGTAAVQDNPKRYRYTAKERDEETGFSYHGARYYVGCLARWCSADPEGLIDGPNLYRYVQNNPIQYVDLDGKRPINARRGAPVRSPLNQGYSYHQPVVQRYSFRHVDPNPNPVRPWRDWYRPLNFAIAADPMKGGHYYPTFEEQQRAQDHYETQLEREFEDLVNRTSTRPQYQQEMILDEYVEMKKWIAYQMSKPLKPWDTLADPIGWSPEPYENRRPGVRYFEHRGRKAHQHHIPTNKGETWKLVFEAIFEDAGFTLDVPFNVITVEGHVGPQPYRYHQIVLYTIRGHIRGEQPQTVQFTVSLVRALRELEAHIQTPGDPLYNMVRGFGSVEAFVGHTDIEFHEAMQTMYGTEFQKYIPPEHMPFIDESALEEIDLDFR